MTYPFFNAHHSPVGAFATFTLGMKGPRGGLGLELAGPANDEVYVGVEDREGGRYRTLPFCSETASGGEDKSGDYDVEGLAGFDRPQTVKWFDDSDVQRTMGAGVDEWRAGDLTFRLISPVKAVPDPDVASEADLRRALIPAVLAELTVDNREGMKP